QTYAQTVPSLASEARENLNRVLQNMGQLNRKWRDHTAINCWHLNDHESAAMWKLYLKSDDGVAIQSTYRNLRDCFNLTEERIFLGLVRYVDYERDVIPEGTMFTPFIHKRKSFQHENEVRALII